MSNVTNCVLVFDILEDEGARIAEVNAFFQYNRPFVSADDPSLPRGWYGGSKMLEVPLYIGAFNYLREAMFVRHLREKVAWEHPECVQLFIKRQDDDLFSIIVL